MPTEISCTTVSISLYSSIVYCVYVKILTSGLEDIYFNQYIEIIQKESVKVRAKIRVSKPSSSQKPPDEQIKMELQISKLFKDLTLNNNAMKAVALEIEQLEIQEQHNSENATDKNDSFSLQVKALKKEMKSRKTHLTNLRKKESLHFSSREKNFF